MRDPDFEKPACPLYEKEAQERAEVISGVEYSLTLRMNQALAEGFEGIL